MSHMLYENYGPAVSKNIKDATEIPGAKHSWIMENWKRFSVRQRSDWNGMDTV